MASSVKTFSIVVDGAFLVQTATENGNIESINLLKVRDIVCTHQDPAVTFARRGIYPYPQINRITLIFNDDRATHEFEIASVTNQAGWTANQAGCLQAEADIRGWINAAISGAAPIVGFATEATQLLVKAAVEAIETNLAGITRTPTYINVAGIANTSVAAGARSISFFNNGPTNATIAGTILLPGKGIDFNAGGENDTLSAITYVTIATGSLDIITIV